ncbi:MAG TPA: DoxX family protein [Tepidiformaceae bacterium]|nr:DoxX family protein [Tepidiformaceae bacterium]
MDTVAGILQILLAVVFLFAGGSKVAGIRMQVDNFNRYGYPQWFRVFTGLVELAGAGGMVAGLFADEAATVAGIVLGSVMVGAAYTDLGKSVPVMVVGPVVLLAVSVAVVILRVAD